MCLFFKKYEPNLEFVNGFKLFTDNDKGLQSAFVSSYRKDLVYKTNILNGVVPTYSRFFIMSLFDDAVHVALNNDRPNWMFVDPSKLIILPVTISGEIYSGRIMARGDITINFKAFTGTQIIVHDNEESRRVSDEALGDWESRKNNYPTGEYS